MRHHSFGHFSYPPQCVEAVKYMASIKCELLVAFAQFMFYVTILNDAMVILFCQIQLALHSSLNII